MSGSIGWLCTERLSNFLRACNVGALKGPKIVGTTLDTAVTAQSSRLY